MEKRGIDFIDMIPLFQKPDTLFESGVRKEYGEDRKILYGFFGVKLYQVCFTMREGKFRIITARRANKRELKHYEQTRNNTGNSYSGWTGFEEKS